MAGVGVAMGAGSGAFGGVTTRPNVPHPDAKPGSLSDAANTIRENTAQVDAGTPGADFVGDGHSNVVDNRAPQPDIQPGAAEPTSSTITPEAIITRACSSLDALNAKAQGTVDTTTTGPDGQQVTTPASRRKA